MITAIREYRTGSYRCAGLLAALKMLSNWSTVVNRYSNAGRDAEQSISHTDGNHDQSANTVHTPVDKLQLRRFGRYLRSLPESAQFRDQEKTHNDPGGKTRATAKRGRHGRKLNEEEWKTAEIDALHVLAAAGVRVQKARALGREEAALS